MNKKNKDQLPEPDLGQGRNFVRPLGNLLREVMDQVDEEDEKENNPQGDDSPPAEVEMGNRRHITPMANIMRQIAQPEIDAAREAAGEAEEE